MNLGLLMVAWTLWCTAHSSLITTRAQCFFQRKLGPWFRYFRLCYNGFAGLTLVPVLWLSHALRTEHLLSWDGAGLGIRALLWILVLGLGYAGARVYDLGLFSGLSQAFGPGGERGPAPVLNQRGILAVIRHPWYLAALILLWIRAREISVSMVLENLLLTLYILIGIRLEEKKLIALFGETYRRYQSRVPALIPSGCRPRGPGLG